MSALKILLTVLILSVASMSAHNSQNPVLYSLTEEQKNIEYTLEEKTFQKINRWMYDDELLDKTIEVNNDIIIRYPQVLDFEDKANEEYINKIIEIASTDIILQYPKYNYNLEVDYKIMLANGKALSIIYEGLFYSFGAAHPEKVFYTVNVDLENLSLVKIEELLSNQQLENLHNMDWKFANGVEEPEIDEAKRLIKDYRKEYYLTENGLGFSVEVPFAFGGHIEYEIENIYFKDNKQLCRFWQYSYVNE